MLTKPTRQPQTFNNPTSTCLDITQYRKHVRPFILASATHRSRLLAGYVERRIWYTQPSRLTRVTTGTLLGMLGTWIARGSPRYVSMEPGQTIAYISDIGATNLQPLFIAGSAVSVVVFDVCFVSERWLRHKGRLAHNTSITQKILSGFACAFAIIGAAGLILLTILDTVDHPNAHDICLGVFMYVYPTIFLRSLLTTSPVLATSSRPSSLVLNTSVWAFTSANTASCALPSGSS